MSPAPAAALAGGAALAAAGAPVREAAFRSGARERTLESTESIGLLRRLAERVPIGERPASYMP